MPVQEGPDDLERLVRQAQAGDAEAFGALYDRWVGRVYRYVAYRVGPGAEAEDLTEETFLKALQYLRSFQWRGDGSFSAWLLRIAHNQVMDARRRQVRRPTLPLDELPDPPSIERPLEEAAVESTWVRQGLGSLTRLQQEVLSLRFGLDLSIEETARVMGKGQGAVKALQHAALKALRQALVSTEGAGRPATQRREGKR